MMRVTRRTALKLSGAAACAPADPLSCLRPGALAGARPRRHRRPEIRRGFSAFDYVNTEAPRGGKIVTQIAQWGTNQNPNTFNTLNIYVFGGDGAAGNGPHVRKLMEGSADEPGSAYGFIAKEVEVSDDRKALRFFLRPRLSSRTGTPITAADVAFSAPDPEGQGPPNLAGSSRRSRDPRRRRTYALVNLNRKSGRSPPECRGGDANFFPYMVGRARFPGIAQRGATRVRPYKLSDYQFGSYIEFERVKDWWAMRCPSSSAATISTAIRYEYYRDRRPRSRR